MEVARALVAAKFTRGKTPTLRHWRGGWWEWRGSHWSEVEQRAARAAAYEFTEHAIYVKGDKVEPWAPNRHTIADLLEALGAVTHLPETVAQPTWIDRARAGTFVATTNGLLHVETRTLLDHTPKFFNLTSVPFAYDAAAPAPGAWLAFLQDLWTPDGGAVDADSIRALGEWFGYVISGRLDLHKILLIVGPTPAGNGVIARTLTALVGPDNVAGPTLSSLAGVLVL